jgi:hypothetical protein
MAPLSLAQLFPPTWPQFASFFLFNIFHLSVFPLALPSPDPCSISNNFLDAGDTIWQKIPYGLCPLGSCKFPEILFIESRKAKRYEGKIYIFYVYSYTYMKRERPIVL